MTLNPRMSRRAVLGGASALALGGFVAACGTSTAPAASEAGNVELVCFNFDPYIKTFATTIGSDFTRRTGTTVKIVNTGQAASASVDRRVESDLASGHTDAIALISGYETSRYASSGRAVALDSMMADQKFDTSQLYPQVLTLGAANGATYGMPYSLSMLVMFYNADTFRRAGLDPDRPPRSFSELRTCAEALVSSKAVKYGATYYNDSSGNYAFQNWLYSNGGRMMDDGGRKILFNQGPGVAVLQFWADLFRSGYGQTMKYAEALAAFGRGDLGIMITASAQVTTVQKASKFELRTAPMPVPDGGVRKCVVGNTCLAVLTKDSAQQHAAFEAISELVSPAGITTLVKLTGYSPANQIAATEPQYLKTFLDQNPLYAAGNSQLPDMTPWFGFPGARSEEIVTALDQQMLLALRGSKSAADALNDAASAATSMLN